MQAVVHPSARHTLGRGRWSGWLMPESTAKDKSRLKDSPSPFQAVGLVQASKQARPPPCPPFCPTQLTLAQGPPMLSTQFVLATSYEGPPGMHVSLPTCLLNPHLSPQVLFQDLTVRDTQLSSLITTSSP